jgi:hypothetical protein
MQSDWRKRRSALSVVAIVSALIGALGCSSGEKKTAGEQRAGAAASGLKETRAELATAKTQVDKSVAAMNALRDGQGQLTTEFATFNADLKKTEEQAAKVRARAADMRARASEYQSKWRQEVASIDDPALRTAANDRAEKVRERYDGITAKANEVRAAYEPFIKQLKGVQTYLSNDLTPAGVQSAGDVFDRATANGKTVAEKIDAVIAELDSVASNFSATPTAATAPPK